ncbi:MAG: DUF3656 domain-containing protein [Anaeroplasmataceae bacterium]
MSELLAPAGNYEAFLAAVSNGADAVYLALEKFGARAYAKNFTIESLRDVIKYAHLRNVKVYITMNTICFNKELNDAYKQIDDIYEAGADGIIIQDLALIDYLVKKCPNMEAHASTQMGLDDSYGVFFVKDLGCKRAVLGRETPIEDIKQIKKETNMSIEIFVHGALCVSFSGNCLMSGLIGYRSGNRGRCVGSCRKKYKLLDSKNNMISDSYILSMKDLNTTHHIKELLVADSLKIEGRMKEPYYVANIIREYRKLLDGKENVKEANYNINKTFNRTFTPGYIFHTDKKDISNTERPNHVGYEIGYISKINKDSYEITLVDTLNQNDAIRIPSKNEEINITVLKMYDGNHNLINSSSTKCYIELKEKLNVGDKVFKTKDTKFIDELTSSYPKEFKRLPISMFLNGEVGTKLSMTISYEDLYVTVESDYIIDRARNNLNKEKVYEQLNRLNDTPYYLENVELYTNYDAFIPNKVLNDLRRKAIDALNEKRLIHNQKTEYEYKLKPISFPLEESPKLAVFCNNQEQYNAALDEGINIIYYKDNVFRRNKISYKPHEGITLVGGYGGINFFKNNKELVSDFSLNVVNSAAVNILHNYGVKRVTISHEINKSDLEDLINTYVKENNGYPNLEMIVYGRQDLMHTNYCPLKVNNLCGKCKQEQYYIKDEYGVFPVLSHADCTTTILNGKILNLLDEMPNIKNINVFRLQFTLEDYNEARSIIKLAKSKLYENNTTKCFNEEINTRGHFNKEIL